jgi:predicted nucleic acid-binding protein
VAEVWIVNASPVITLAKIGQLRLLEELAAELVMPEAVAGEILAGPGDDPARKQVAAGWGAKASAARVPDAVLEWGLGAGESAVLALALERTGATAVLDDASARTAARSLGVALIGTIGVVMRAKAQGRIASAARLIGELQAAGLHVDTAVIRAALGQIGEEWPGR